MDTENPEQMAEIVFAELQYHSKIKVLMLIVSLPYADKIVKKWFYFKYTNNSLRTH